MVETVPPTETQFELSVFGGSSGESLVIHLGDGEWMIVDSCLHPSSGTPAALGYLEALGVDLGSVQLILATHWDDDHIQGLAECLQRCPNAMFCCSSAYVGAEFAALTLAYPPSVPTSGVREVVKCFDLVRERQRTGGPGAVARRVIEHQLTWRSDDDRVIVYALAPTAAAIMRAEQSIARELLPKAQLRRSIGRITPNQASAVVTVRFPSDAVLLGGDLVERDSGGSGWSAVAQQFRETDPRSSVFKIPHHGSEGAHFDGQWDTLIVLDEPRLAICTSFASQKLPRLGDLRRLCERASAVYLTGGDDRIDLALSNSEQRAMRDAGVKITAPRALGHVRLRREIETEGGWEVEISGNARHVAASDLAEPSPPRRRRRR